MNALLDCETETQQWRRNFIRVSASLIEGYAHCLRELCVGFEFSAGLTTKEKQVLETERGFSADERIKRSLKAAYKHFELPSAPEFGDHNWCVAKPLWAKRDGLMHPKVPADLELSDALWNDLHDGVVWIMAQLFNFLPLLQEKYLGGRHSGAGA
jgi:hypothetical protein